MTADTGIGLDIGTVRTKLAVAESAPVWHAPSGATAVPAALAATGVDPRRADVVVAVPDRWTGGAGDTWTSSPDDSEDGAALRRLLAELGFASARLVPGLQCVAAASGAREGCVLVCDVGSSTVDAAVYECDGDASRLLDVEHADAVTIGMLPPGVDDERCRRAARARLVLERAARQTRYLGTPVYFPDRPDAITAEQVLAALRPLAALAADAVRRLLARTTEPLLPEMVLTGGNAIGPVVRSVTDAARGRVRSATCLEPTAAALGALRIATGRARALDGYPHELGVAVRRIRRGLLESATLSISDAPLVVTVAEDHSGPLPVLVRPHRQGPWRSTVGPAGVSVPAGRYRVLPLGRRAGLGAVLLRPVDGGADVVYPLGPDAGPAVSETDQPRSET